MLQSITIRNIAVIDKLHIEFEKNFSVLTGETGAGKSILLDSLGFALGSRSHPTKLIRDGEEEASVSVVFDGLPDLIHSFLVDHGFEIEPPLIIRRTIGRDGKSKAFLNDQPVSVSLLTQVTLYLVEIHGQFDHLLNTPQQLESLDRYLNLSRIPLENAYHQWKTCENKLLETLESSSINTKRLEEISFLIQELEQLSPKEKEEEELLDLKETAKNTDKIQTISNLVHELYEEPVALEKRVAVLHRHLESLHVPKLLTLKHSVGGMLMALRDIQSEAQDIAFSLEDSSLSLDLIEERLYKLRQVARKHHASTKDLCQILCDLKEEKENLTGRKSSLSVLQDQVNLSKTNYQKTAEEFYRVRQKGGEDLSRVIKKTLEPLKLPHAVFLVSFQELPESQWSSKGMHKMEFHISTNPGLSPGPLNKVASGGELSRVMLALKSALKQRNSIPTIIFDEVDVGLGGSVAAAMGEQLSFLSRDSQILAITHSPQLAAYADHHFCVEKFIGEGKTTSSIRNLSPQERVEELSRMLAGKNMTDLTRATAQELLNDKITI